MPPIDVYEIGGMYFVQDGHHRVSVARQMDLEVIEANVTQIVNRGRRRRERAHRTTSPSRATSASSSSGCRCPLRPATASSSRKAPGTRGSPRESRRGAFARCRRAGEFMTREEVAKEWFERGVRARREALREAGLAEGQTDAEAYARIVSLRYLLLRTHALGRGDARPPARRAPPQAAARRGHAHAHHAGRPPRLGSVAQVRA